jgi:hypothetical protein
MLPILLFLIFIGAVYFTAHPLFSQKNYKLNLNFNQAELTKKRRLINLFSQIKEAEFEHQMGITVEEDFNRTKAELKSEASKIIENSDTPQNISFNTCENCKKTNDSNSKFCSHCGHNLFEIKCTNCQCELTPKDKFCSQCGNKA